jgi:pyrimidine dimer DNA glycosylase
MRLWSLHPCLLDSKGLVALWREALLAQKVLQGKTKGYRHHPQLRRFRQCGEPVAAIASYLWPVHDEATARGYAFDSSKIAGDRRPMRIPVNEGQVAFEWAHLKDKVRQRDLLHFETACQRRKIIAHPLFSVVAGGIEEWERGKARPQSRLVAKLNA